jgi:CheY-like chemotaxis protein
MSARVLVVEDNPANLELIGDWLESEQFQVTTATTIDEACEALKDKVPDIVLLDVQLGPEDGLEVVGRIRSSSQWRTIPVIAVTAHAMVTDHERVLRAGCDACVSKPIDFRQLRDELEKWLARSRHAPSSV